MTLQKMVDGELVDLTPEEITDYEAKIAAHVATPIIHKVPRLLIIDRLVALGVYGAVKTALKGLDVDEVSFDRFMAAPFIYSNNAEVLTLFAALGVDASVVLAPESDGV